MEMTESEAKEVLRRTAEELGFEKMLKGQSYAEMSESLVDGMKNFYRENGASAHDEETVVRIITTHYERELKDYMEKQN